MVSIWKWYVCPIWKLTQYPQAFPDGTILQKMILKILPVLSFHKE